MLRLSDYASATLQAKSGLCVPKSVNPGQPRVAEKLSYRLPKPPRHLSGRPALDQATLAGIRDDLVHLLSVSWAEIGWHLRHAKSLEELQRAFEPLRGKNNNPLIQRFLRTTVSPATGEELRFARKALGEATKRRYAAQARCDDQIENCRKAETMPKQSWAESAVNLHREPVKRQPKPLELAKELHSAEKLERTLEKQLAEREVGFAQDQLLRFLAEGRCVCNPLRLANAMAGLLILTARVSYNRCSKIKCAVWPEFDFQLFEKIESIWNSRHRYRHLSVVQLYRQEIKKLPREMRRRNNKPEHSLRTLLAEHFGCLELAIEQSLESGVDLPDSVPYHLQL